MPLRTTEDVLNSERSKYRDLILEEYNWPSDYVYDIVDLESWYNNQYTIFDYLGVDYLTLNVNYDTRDDHSNTVSGEILAKAMWVMMVKVAEDLEQNDAIIVDHTSAQDFDIIPPYWLEKAKELTIHYVHTSHSAQPIQGAIWLETVDSNYSLAWRREASIGLLGDENPPEIKLYSGNGQTVYVDPFNYWTGSGIQYTQDVTGSLYKVIRPWGSEGNDTVMDQGEVSWNYSYYDTTFWGNPGADQAGVDREVAVQDWVTNLDSNNYGVVIKAPLQTTSTRYRFYSSEHPVKQESPRLVITYTKGGIIYTPDVNNDGVINIIDLALVIFNQGRDPANPNYEHLNLDSDNDIDFDDVQIIINNL